MKGESGSGGSSLTGKPLPDENPSTTDPREALHWIRVYSDLLDFKGGVLSTAHEILDEVQTPEARREAVTTDLALLEGENRNLRQRLEFWKRRHRELEPPDR